MLEVVEGGKKGGLVPAMGHAFGEDLTCLGCKVGYFQHHNNPTRCRFPGFRASRGGGVVYWEGIARRDQEDAA